MTDVVKFDHDPSEQEIFDAVLTNISKQGKCVDQSDKCQYRYKFGNGPYHRCAFGLFIPDEVYHEAFETLCIEEIIDHGEGLPKYLTTHLTLLESLQDAHDTSQGLRNFQLKMEMVADKYHQTIVYSAA